MLSRRLLSSLILIIILTASIFWFPRPVVAVVVALVVGIGLWEFYAITEIKGFRPFKGYGTFCGIALSVITYLVISYKQIDNEYIIILLFLILVTVLVKHTFVKNGSSAIVNSAVTMLGVLYISFTFTFIIKLRYIPNASDGKAWVIALFIITKFSDIFAYFGGTRWGRHKLIPRISAKKTVEGSLFGVLGSVSAALVCRMFFLSGLGWIAIAGLGALLSVVGQIGDLVESLIKRDAQIKDSGKLVPGMGGVLDFMDSLLFAGPAMYIYLKLML